MKMPLVHRLAYSWCGWPKSGAFPAEPGPDSFATLDAAWATDGLVRIARRWEGVRLQVTFRAGPDIAPAAVAARAKGRLSHSLRAAGWRGAFSRKVALRSLGENTPGQVLGYIATQLDRAEFADPRYARSLAEAAWENPSFDLSEPLPTARGRYWCNLHLVAVTDSRWRMGREDFVGRVRDAVLGWGAALAAEGRDDDARPGVRALAVMPDHVHVAARAPVDRSPADLAEGLWRSLNRAAGCRLFSDRVYVGTFSEYPLSVVRRRPD